VYKVENIQTALSRLNQNCSVFNSLLGFRQQALMVSTRPKSSNSRDTRLRGQVSCSIHCETFKTYSLVNVVANSRSRWRRQLVGALKQLGYKVRGRVADEIALTRPLYPTTSLVQELKVLERVHSGQIPLRKRLKVPQMRRRNRRSMQAWSTLQDLLGKSELLWDLCVCSFNREGFLVGANEVVVDVQVSTVVRLNEPLQICMLASIATAAEDAGAVDAAISALKHRGYKESAYSRAYCGVRMFQSALVAAREAQRIFSMLTGCVSSPSHFAEQNEGGDGRRSRAGKVSAKKKASRTGVGTKARSKSKS
jgi:hypothetical protein